MYWEDSGEKEAGERGREVEVLLGKRSHDKCLFGGVIYDDSDATYARYLLL
jgi:hypothetical protein